MTVLALEPSARPHELGAQDRHADCDRDNAGGGKQQHGGARRRQREADHDFRDALGLRQRR